MNERGKIFNADKPEAAVIETEILKKIKAAEERLATMAQVIGADFGMSVKFGKIGGGSYFNPEDNSITLDPSIILEDKEYLAEFIAGHEGGHRAITRSLEQIGMSREKMIELYKKIGFGYLANCLEDCSDNNWVGQLFVKFQEDSEKFYAEQFLRDNTVMSTPEIDLIIKRLGYTPKFVSFGSEIIRRWATARYSDGLEDNVKSALEQTQVDAEDYQGEIPGTHSKEGERLKSAKERFRIFFEKIWPEAERLIKMDIDEEKLRQLADELNKRPFDAAQGDIKKENALPLELQKELLDKIEENLRELLGDIEAKIDKLKEKMDKTADQNEKDAIAKQMSELLGESDELKEGKKVCVPWDKLSDELKNKLKEIFDNLPREVKERLEEAARKQLEELDDALIIATRGKLADDASPLTHGEIIEIEENEKSIRSEDERRENDRRLEKEREQKLAEKIRAKLEGELSEYDRIYQEIAPLADDLFNRIHQIFLPKRHPRWQKGNPTGQRLDLAKVMQFQADRSIYDKLWERKTIPRKIDYKFTLLNDLSGSMAGEKIQQDFRAKVLLTETLNRLGIETQILGFQDELIVYKNFNEELSPEIRRKMTVMLREVSNKGEHNKASYNSDGYCLKQAAELLTKRKGKDSFLLVLSDGEPAPDPAHGGEEFELTKVVAEIRKKTKHKLIGLGLGPGTKHVAKYYPTSLPNLDLKNLSRLLGDLLEDMIEFPNKYK